MRRAWPLVVPAGLLLFLVSARAQERPVERSFVVGETRRYRVELTIRTEVERQQTEKIGAKTYVIPSLTTADASVSWQVTRRIAAVKEDGSAEIEERLDGFSEARGQGNGPDWEPMLNSLKVALGSWREERTLRYEEMRDGQLRGISLLAAPLLDESAPQLLTPWMARALRPASALSGKPLRFQQRWQEPRQVQLPNWTNVQGTESGEWLEASGSGEPAAQLHVVQQISGSVSRGADAPVEGSADGKFHGESLSVISLADGRLLSATRSASREITWTLARVEGLPDAPRFRGRLSVEIRIAEIE